MAKSTFDLVSLQQGQPVVTASSKIVGKVKELSYEKSNLKFLTALVENKVIVWDMAGKNAMGLDTGYDLMMDTPQVYRWVPTDKIVDRQPNDLTGFTKIILANEL